jgi:hypothetical protein
VTMPPTWITDEELLARADTIVRPGEDTPPPDWLSAVVHDSNEAAHNAVVSALGGRGYTPSQIAVWPRAREFVIDIALHWVETKTKLDLDMGQRGQAVPSMLLDRRPELLTVDITDAEGNLIFPESESIKVVGHGRLNTLDERFRRRDGHWRRW